MSAKVNSYLLQINKALLACLLWCLVFTIKPMHHDAPYEKIRISYTTPQSYKAALTPVKAQLFEKNSSTYNLMHVVQSCEWKQLTISREYQVVIEDIVEKLENDQERSVINIELYTSPDQNDKSIYALIKKAGKIHQIRCYELQVVTGLKAAIQYRDLDAIERLLTCQSAIDPNAPFEEMAPLDYALVVGGEARFRMAEILIKHGARCDFSRDNSSKLELYIYLMESLGSGTIQEETIKRLLETSARANSQSIILLESYLMNLNSDQEVIKMPKSVADINKNSKLRQREQGKEKLLSLLQQLKNIIEKRKINEETPANTTCRSSYNYPNKLHGKSSVLLGITSLS